jgi:hypothetical protein
MQASQKFDFLSAIMFYEDGKLDEEETRELFQYLVDTGTVWQLQGSYGRTARAMIDAGEIQERGMR